MSSFRVIDPFAYFDEALAIGGSAKFYEAGTTTPADVFADPDLTVNNGSSVAVGTDGRLKKETWGDATKSYRARIYKKDGTLIRDRDNIGVAGAGGLTIPSLVTGEFLTNNGTSLDWAAIRQLLDPTGATGKTIMSNGTAWVFTAMPSDGENGKNADVTVTASSAVIGSGSPTSDKLLIQSDSVTLEATGTHTTDKNVSFTTQFKSLFGSPMLVSNSSSVSPSGYAPIVSALNPSTSGFGCHAEGNDGEKIINNVIVSWIAIGSIAP